MPASPAARRSLSVSLRSVRSCSHLARLAGGWSSNAFRLTAAGGALLLGRPDGDGETFGRLQAEAHHRLVDRADVLDVQGPVGDALAVEHDELLQHPVDGAVGDQGRVDAFVDLPGAARSAALQEAIPVGVEEGAVARGEPHRARPGAVVDHAEQRESWAYPPKRWSMVSGWSAASSRSRS